MAKTGAFGIVVSGGPAPGINSAISSAVIAAARQGYRCYGLQEGFEGVCALGVEALRPLEIGNVSTIHTEGGSILGVSRYNPFADTSRTEQLLRVLQEREIDKVIVIGGEGSAFLSLQMSRRAPHLKVAHLPKTIDNDLPLPDATPSFGYETACSAGAAIVHTMMVDARTCRRWYLVTSMGRNAGYLALGVGLASGATLTIIPEEFSHSTVTLEQLADIIFHSIRTRREMRRDHGVALIAEGIIDKLDPTGSPLLRSLPRDELGRIRHSEVELEDLLLPALRTRCEQEGLQTKILAKNLGYELRCQSPIAFDIEYTRFLGFAAVELLLAGHSGIMVTRNLDTIGCMPLAELEQPDGRIRSRTVQLDSDLYRVARSYMIR